MWPDRSFALNLATSSLDLLNSMSYDLVQFTESSARTEKEKDGWNQRKEPALVM